MRDDVKRELGSELDAGLSGLAGAYDAGPPDRAQMLAQVYLHSELFKEKRMGMIERLFAGRHWGAQAAIAIALLAAIGVIAVLVPPYQHSLSATEGAVLTYDLSGVTDVEAVLGQLKGVKAKLAGELPKGAEIKIIARVERREVKHEGEGAAKASAKLEPEAKGMSVASLVISGGDDALTERVAAAVAQAVPTLPAPTRGDATWFSENGGMIDGIMIALNFDGKDHQFTFPKDATEQQIESTINDWLKVNKPEFEHSVDVNISGDGKERRIEVRIESKGEAKGAPTQ